MPDKDNTNRVILVRHRTFTSRFAVFFKKIVKRYPISTKAVMVSSQRD